MAQADKKGFSLPELLAVIAIMAILAAVSAPFIRDYMKDAANDKSKVALQIAAQAHKTFLTDYPAATIQATTAINSASSVVCSSVARKSANPPGILLGCRYLQHMPVVDASKYLIYIGRNSTYCTMAPTGALACMRGVGSDSKYGASYQAWVDQFGNLKDIYD